MLTFGRLKNIDSHSRHSQLFKLYIRPRNRVRHYSTFKDNSILVSMIILQYTTQPKSKQWFLWIPRSGGGTQKKKKEGWGLDKEIMVDTNHLSIEWRSSSVDSCV